MGTNAATPGVCRTGHQRGLQNGLATTGRVWAAEATWTFRRSPDGEPEAVGSTAPLGLDRCGQSCTSSRTRTAAVVNAPRSGCQPRPLGCPYRQLVGVRIPAEPASHKREPVVVALRESRPDLRVFSNFSRSNSGTPGSPLDQPSTQSRQFTPRRALPYPPPHPPTIFRNICPSSNLQETRGSRRGATRRRSSLLTPPEPVVGGPWLGARGWGACVGGHHGGRSPGGMARWLPRLVPVALPGNPPSANDATRAPATGSPPGGDRRFPVWAAPERPAVSLPGRHGLCCGQSTPLT